MKCLPLSLKFRDHYFQIDAFDLVIHTTKRIMVYLSRTDFLHETCFNREESNILEASIKFGIDGAQSGTTYAYRFQENNGMTQICPCHNGPFSFEIRQK